MNLSRVTQDMLDAATRAGADHADALAVTARSQSLEVLNGALEHAERAEGTDIGLRVFVGQRQAVVSASDTRTVTIEKMALRAVAMAKEAPEDPYAGLADPDQLAQTRDADELEIFDPSAEPTPAELQDMALRTEATAADVPGISQVQSTGAGHSTQEIYLAATNGFGGGYKRSHSSLHCVTITGSGTDMERDYYGDNRIFRSDLEQPEYIGQTAAERTLQRAGARRPKTGTYPVLFDERVSSSLIGHFLLAINGAAIARGSSWLRDALGQQVLPNAMTLTEDPRRPRVSGSRPFDAEGLQTYRRDIVQDGVLTGWTLDLATARKLGMDSTANAARGPGTRPSPSSSNVTLTPGDKTRDDLIRDMGTGLLVTSMIGSTINPNTGDYSRGASGLWVENGEIQYPVNECTIAGNLRDMLLRIIPANDARTHLSRVVPSLLVEGMTLAGE